MIIGMKRFALHPGNMISVNDGDEHHVSAPQLAQLYGVSMQECVIVDPCRPDAIRGVDLEVLLHLFPSYQGAAYWNVSSIERAQYPVRVRRADPDAIVGEVRTTRSGIKRAAQRLVSARP